MKVRIPSKQSVVAAVHEPIEPGTRFYVITDEDLRAAWNAEPNANIWFMWAVNNYGLDAFDFKRKVHQSSVTDGSAILYETDNQPITLSDGKQVSPQELLEDYYTLDDWETHLAWSDEEKIRKLLSPYEDKHFSRREQMEIQKALKAEGYTAEEITQGLQELHTVYKN